MASSHLTYDLHVTYSSGASESAAALRTMLSDRGLRLRLSTHFRVGPDQPSGALRPRSPVARLNAVLIGADMTKDASLAPPIREPWIAILSPGYPIDAARVPNHLIGEGIIDLRDGCADRDLLNLLKSAIVSGAEVMDPGADPGRALGSYALKRATRASYDSIAEKFTMQWADHLPHAPLEKLLALIPKRSSILDAGCGPGHHASFLTKQGHDVVGIDTSLNMISIARRRSPTINFEQMDAQAIPYPSASFDAIWSAGMPMHVPREEFVSFLRGLKRLLKPNGVVGINMQVDRTSEIVERDSDRRFFEYYRSSSDIANLMHEAGFTIIDEDYGETTRNTHELDLNLKWSTLFATAQQIRNSEHLRGHSVKPEE